MSGYGMAWSLLVAAAVATGGVFFLRPVSERPGVLTDRMLIGGGLALLASRSLAVAFTGLESRDVAAGYGSDVEFWLIASATLGWAGRSPRPRPWRNTRTRILEVTPSVLLAYGGYVALCPIRRGCAAASGALLLHLAVAAALVALALMLHSVWIITPMTRLLLALVVTAAGRSVLGLAAANASSGDVAVSIVLVGIGALLMAWSIARWYLSERARKRLAGRTSGP